jgi:hypothetical protein
LSQHRQSAIATFSVNLSPKSASFSVKEDRSRGFSIAITLLTTTTMTRDLFLVLSLALAACGEINAEEPNSLLEAPRRLAEDWIAGYEPRTFVKNHAAIDLDQAQIENLLDQRHLTSAKTIYVQGGHSQSIARLKLLDAPPPVKPILSETLVLGRTNVGVLVRGNLIEELTWTSSDKEVNILVEYNTNEEQMEYVDCQVGGLVSISSANRDGCEYN